MIGFNTVLPLSADTSVDRFLELCRQWQQGSPHRTLPLDSRPIHDGLRYDSDLESLEFVRVEADGAVHCGVRHVRRDEEGEWWTDVVGCKKADEFPVAIVSSRSRFDLDAHVELPKTPYIVGLLIRETGPMLDDGLLIETAAKPVTPDNLDLVAALLNGERNNRLPVVYVSRPFFGDDAIVDPVRLGQRLGGLAHVFYETDSEWSKALRERTDGKNAYNGSVGIYWPNRSYRRFYPRILQEDIGQKILDYIKRGLNTRRIPDECRWFRAQQLKFQQKLERHRAGAEEAELLLEMALKENDAMREQISSLEAEVRYLREMAQAMLDSGLEERTPLLLKGSEPELFENEQAELVMEVLEDRIRTGHCSMRARNMLASILDANARTNNKETFLAKIKAILTETGGLSAKGRRELVRLGFDITEDGKHYKLAVRNDGRYAHPIPKTPSDVRSMENNFAQLKKRLF